MLDRRTFMTGVAAASAAPVTARAAPDATPGRVFLLYIEERRAANMLHHMDDTSRVVLIDLRRMRFMPGEVGPGDTVMIAYSESDFIRATAKRFREALPRSITITLG